MSGARIGIGYDSHRFDPGRRLVLGGVAIPEGPGLAGHSDADAVAHAVADAVLGAAALGDIGTHFPPSDVAWKDADSMELLGVAVRLAHEAGYGVGNVDVTVICETPRIGPYADAMRKRLAQVLGVGPSAVSVKGKSNEGLGWIGRGEGMAVLASALVTQL